eukprot:1347367-Pyramimonas_sp.AAC.1
MDTAVSILGRDDAGETRHQEGDTVDEEQSSDPGVEADLFAAHHRARARPDTPDTQDVQSHVGAVCSAGPSHGPPNSDGGRSEGDINGGPPRCRTARHLPRQRQRTRGRSTSSCARPRMLAGTQTPGGAAPRGIGSCAGRSAAAGSQSTR